MFGFLIDCYYFEKLGKSFTYVLTLGFVYPFLMLALSFLIDDCIAS